MDTETIVAHVRFGLYDRQGREFGVMVTFTHLRDDAVELHVQRTRNGKLHGRSRGPTIVWGLDDAKFSAKLRVDGERYLASKKAVNVTKRPLALS